MTNYPRDEFDRVPEFSNRSGSHRENGWASAASVGGARSGLRWLMVFGAIALVVGLFSFMVLPKLTGATTDPAPVAASSSGTQDAADSSESTSADEASETPAESESADEASESTEASSSTEASESGLAEDADTSMAMGVYNGAKVGGLAGKARTELQDAGFGNVAASNWTKKVNYSTVYYRAETHRATAEAAADALGITSVMQSANIPGNIAIVLGSNYN
ncbi:LytR C-terminal domain-containing protein [Paeniglutamicibacter sulfureus]|uniref:LytR C-terminal domain-containing protein n=1 Tax=Paeniglutamicibacter sulfureus TaxID=43666 RepID=UPI0026663087|nr:LytR C-terminal domain-containing protein [Paeniglutamicibacter sulfureus]MDO2933488.1 LytR C-terminal domain-containing protein [Paeniglutamicibacter sulfureus]